MTFLELDAILFDMDGTLIDVGRSYHEATRMTAQLLLGERIDDDEVIQVKRLPGFNNDWDATWALVQRRRLGSIVAPGDGDRLSPAYRRLVDIFQTYYLGARAWHEQSGHQPPFAWDEPLIQRETLLVAPEVLRRLAPFSIGIATSRPRAEALMAVHQHGLNGFFDDGKIVGLEDAPREKPHPAPLLELVARIGCKNPAYVGDTINDAIAAIGAGMPFIHIGTDPLVDPALDRQVARRLSTVNDLVEHVRPLAAELSPEAVR